MNTLDIILLLAGVICFVLAAARVQWRVELVALGLALCFAVPLIAHVKRA